MVEEEEVKTHTQVQESGFRDSAEIKLSLSHDGTRLTQIGAAERWSKSGKRQREDWLQAAR